MRATPSRSGPAPTSRVGLAALNLASQGLANEGELNRLLAPDQSAALAALQVTLPRLFTTDAAVLDALTVPWWFLVGMIPIAGVVFALDGVLLGAADAAYLRTATMAAALVGFLPLIWLSYAFGWGLAGIWSGLAAFMVLRCAAVVLRFLGHRWERVGTAPS